MIVIGIDPGTHTCGYARINTESRIIYQAEEAKSLFQDADNRIIKIAKDVFDLVDCQSYPPPDAIFIEATHFNRNKTVNDMYQRLVGGLMTTLGHGGYPEIKYVQNTTMKLAIGGHGKAEKSKIASGVLGFFSNSPHQESVRAVLALIENKQWDVTDAIAIALTGARALK